MSNHLSSPRLFVFAQILSSLFQPVQFFQTINILVSENTDLALRARYPLFESIPAAYVQLYKLFC